MKIGNESLWVGCPASSESGLKTSPENLGNLGLHQPLGSHSGEKHTGWFFSHCLMMGVTIKLRNRNFLFKTWVFNNQFRTQCFQIYMVILEKDEAVSSKKQFEKYEIYIFAEPFYWFCLTSCGKEDIWRSLLYYCFSREMDILYSTSHSNQWSLPKHWK